MNENLYIIYHTFSPRKIKYFNDNKTTYTGQIVQQREERVYILENKQGEIYFLKCILSFNLLHEQENWIIAQKNYRRTFINLQAQLLAKPFPKFYGYMHRLQISLWKN